MSFSRNSESLDVILLSADDAAMPERIHRVLLLRLLLPNLPMSSSWCLTARDLRRPIIFHVVHASVNDSWHHFSPHSQWHTWLLWASAFCCRFFFLLKLLQSHPRIGDVVVQPSQRTPVNGLGFSYANASSHPREPRVRFFIVCVCVRCSRCTERRLRPPKSFMPRATNLPVLFLFLFFFSFFYFSFFSLYRVSRLVFGLLQCIEMLPLCRK